MGSIRTYSTRRMCAYSFVVLTILLHSLFSATLFYSLFACQVPFVLNATVGNIIALCGSCFLSGPHSQMKKMWADTRRTATIAYLGSLFFTLFIAFVPGVPGPRGLYLLLLMISQYVSITWYCLSYIPYARETVLGCLQRRMNSFMGDE